MSWAIAEKGYSQRRACALVGIDPRVYRYRSRRDGDAPLRTRLRELSAERRRFGYRRLHILLRREGWEVNWKKLYRLYREEKLTVRKRGGRKRALGTRAPMAVPQGPNQRWSLDFVSDALSCGRRFRVLCVIDDFSRECLATVVDTSLSGQRVARELDRIAETRGYPCLVVSDNGTKLTSNASLKWQEDRKVEWHDIAPSKPMQNAFVESFIGRLRPLSAFADKRLPGSGRMPQRASLRRLAPCPPFDRGMARRLQPSPPAHEPRRPHPAGISQPVREGPNPEQTLPLSDDNQGRRAITSPRPA